MKNQKSLILFLFLTFFINEVYAHAEAKVRNNCTFGNKYRSFAKVNGPNGCARTVNQNNNCSGTNTGLLQLYKSPDNCTCQGPVPISITDPIGAAARGISKEDEVSVYAFKIGNCRRYRAGGTMNPIDEPELQNTDSGVESFASFRDFKINYENGSLNLYNFNAKLKIESQDFKNEFALFQIVVNGIKYDLSGNEITTELLKTEVYLQNGKMYFKGNNVFSDLDFEEYSTEYYYEAKLENSDLQIDLGSSIDTAMSIEVSIKGDVGNILAGDSELREFDYTVVTSLNLETNVYQVIIDSESDKSLNLAVKDLNSPNTLYINDVKIIGCQRKIITLDDNFINNTNGQILLLQTETDDGQIMNKVILKSQ